MDFSQLSKYKLWFVDYVKHFYGSDNLVNTNIRLKEDHSFRVCQEMNYITENLNLTPNQKLIAETIALFHDFGRFEQFRKFRTYNDTKSINHCCLGVEVLAETKIISDLSQNEQDATIAAIRYHGQKELPGDLNGENLLFCQLIRDADKLDIFHLLMDYYKKYAENPAGFDIEMEFPPDGPCSKEVIDAILQQQKVEYRLLKSWNDMKLCQLSWVYDINFAPTMQKIKNEKYLERVLDFLPDSEDILLVRKKVIDFVESKLSNE